MVRDPTDKMDEKEVRGEDTGGHHTVKKTKKVIKKDFKVPDEWFNADG